MSHQGRANHDNGSGDDTDDTFAGQTPRTDENGVVYYLWPDGSPRNVPYQPGTGQRLLTPEELDASTAQGEAFTGPPHEAPDYSEFYDSLNRSLDQQQALAERQIAIAERTAAIAEEQYAFYKDNFQPLITDLLGKAERGIDSDYAAALAGERTRQAFNATAGTQERDLRRLGVDPRSDLYDGLDAQTDDARKLATTGARNNARMEAVDTSKRMRIEASGMAAGVPAQGLSALSSSAGTLAGAASTAANAQAGTNQVQQAQLSANTNQAWTANATNAAQAQFNADAAFANTMANAQAVNSVFGAAGVGLGAYTGSGSGGGNQVGQNQVMSAPPTPRMPGYSPSLYGYGNEERYA